MFLINGWRKTAGGVLLAASVMTGGEVTAQEQGVVDRTIYALDAAGYEIEGVWDTLLGRVRIEARRPDGALRELVIDPRTGAVLRDAILPDRSGSFLSELFQQSRSDPSVLSVGGTGGSSQQRSTGNSGPGAQSDSAVSTVTQGTGSVVDSVTDSVGGLLD